MTNVKKGRDWRGNEGGRVLGKGRRGVTMPSVESSIISMVYDNYTLTAVHYLHTHKHASVQFSHLVVSDSAILWTAVPQASLTHHQLPESTQTHVHWVRNSIKPSHPLSSPSPPALNLSQHQGLFKWVSSSHPVANVLEFQLQHQSF